MHQIRSRLGELTSAPPDLLAGFKGPTSKGRDGKEGKGKGGEGKGGDGKGKEEGEGGVSRI